MTPGWVLIGAVVVAFVGYVAALATMDTGPDWVAEWGVVVGHAALVVAFVCVLVLVAASIGLHVEIGT